MAQEGEAVPEVEEAEEFDLGPEVRVVVSGEVLEGTLEEMQASGMVEMAPDAALSSFGAFLLATSRPLSMHSVLTLAAIAMATDRRHRLTH